jgi:hypothetical protein
MWIEFLKIYQLTDGIDFRMVRYLAHNYYHGRIERLVVLTPLPLEVLQLGRGM